MIRGLSLGNYPSSLPCLPISTKLLVTWKYVLLCRCNTTHFIRCYVRLIIILGGSTTVLHWITMLVHGSRRRVPNVSSSSGGRRSRGRFGSFVYDFVRQATRSIQRRHSSEGTFSSSAVTHTSFPSAVHTMDMSCIEATRICDPHRVELQYGRTCWINIHATTTRWAFDP